MYIDSKAEKFSTCDILITTDVGSLSYLLCVVNFDSKSKIVAIRKKIKEQITKLLCSLAQVFPTFRFQCTLYS